MKALITGITGQDGSYLAELLIAEGYNVIGLKRRSSTDNLERVRHIDCPLFKIEEFEIADSGSVYSVVERHQPDEIYNLAAQSHVKTSFDQPNYTTQVNTIGVINFLEAIRRFSPSTRFYQASTSEMFGKNVDEFTEDDSNSRSNKKYYQDEFTAFEPQSPYGAAKLASHHLVRMYREGFDLHASCGILFNHESERRGENFVTRKITKWIAAYYAWAQEQGGIFADFEFSEDFIHSPTSSHPKLRLGNLDAYRDWGHAQDYVKAMWLMLQQEIPDDYVIATGETFSVRNFLSHAFGYIGIDDYEDLVVIDPAFYRPAEVEYLCGLPTKAEDKLGWKPEISFVDLVHRMMESDINAEKEEIF
jgi:GDPmannose 4,6-dehydratase